MMPSVLRPKSGLEFLPPPLNSPIKFRFKVLRCNFSPLLGFPLFSTPPPALQNQPFGFIHVSSPPSVTRHPHCQIEPPVSMGEGPFLPFLHLSKADQLTYRCLQHIVISLRSVYFSPPYLLSNPFLRLVAAAAAHKIYLFFAKPIEWRVF